MSSSSYTSVILNQLYEGKRLSLVFSSERDRENTRKALYNYKRGQDEILSVLLQEDRKILRYVKEPVSHKDNEEEKFRATVWIEAPTVVFSFEILDHHFSLEEKEEEKK